MRVAAFIALLLLVAVSRSSAIDCNETWKWWFLGSTPNQQTAELYEKIATKYLFVSDLKVLSEDLAPLYQSLADTIGSYEDAETGALLLRLFHYSVARPFFLVSLCERISQNLFSYVATNELRMLRPDLKVDLMVAASLGMNVVIPTDQYSGFRDSSVIQQAIAIDYPNHRHDIDIIDRCRLFVQGFDAGTKRLEYSNILDTAFAARMYELFAWQLDSVSQHAKQHSADGKWRLLQRVTLSLTLRTTRETRMSAVAEHSASAMAKEVLLAERSCTPSYPEARLIANVNRYFNHIRHSEGDQIDLLVGDLFLLQIISDASSPASGVILRDRDLATSLLDYRRVRYGNIDRSALDSVFESRRVRERTYSSCYGHIYAAAAGYQPLDHEYNTCSLEFVLDRLPADSYLMIRRALAYQRFGYFEKYRELMREALAQIKIAHARVELSWRALEILLSKPADIQDYGSEKDAVLLLAILTAMRFDKELVERSDPFLTGGRRSEARNTIISILRELVVDGSRDSSRSAKRISDAFLSEIMTGLIRLKARTTNQSRESPMNCDEVDEYDEPKKLNQYGVCETIRKWIESFPLMPYVNGDMPVDNHVLKYMSDLSNLTTIYSRYDRLSTSRVNTSNWQPKAGHIYLYANRYPAAENLLLSSIDAQSDSLYQWVFLVVTNDTSLYLFDIPDSMIQSGIADKQRALSYGLNMSTGIDSLFYTMVMSVIQGADKTVVFLPEGPLYAYNPYLIKYGNAMLIDTVAISVAARVNQTANSIFATRKISVLKPSNLDLTFSEAELDSLKGAAQVGKQTVEVVEDIANERDLAKELKSSDVLHVVSHATNADLRSSISRDVTKLELLQRDNIAGFARMLWSPLIQYRSPLHIDGAMYGDGYLAPFEIELYGVPIADLVYLSTCRTVTTTYDAWEPPDGLLRTLMLRGARCVVASTIAVPDKFPSLFSAKFYRYLFESGSPHLAATRVVREGIRDGSNVLGYGAYFPIYFESE